MTGHYNVCNGTGFCSFCLKSLLLCCLDFSRLSLPSLFECNTQCASETHPEKHRDSPHDCCSSFENFSQIRPHPNSSNLLRCPIDENSEHMGLALVSPLYLRPRHHPLKPHRARHCGDSPCQTRSHLVLSVHASALGTPTPIVSSEMEAALVVSLICLPKWVDALYHLWWWDPRDPVRWPLVIRSAMLACRTFLHEKLWPHWNMQGPSTSDSGQLLLAFHRPAYSNLNRTGWDQTAECPTHLLECLDCATSDAEDFRVCLNEDPGDWLRRSSTLASRTWLRPSWTFPAGLSPHRICHHGHSPRQSLHFHGPCGQELAQLRHHWWIPNLQRIFNSRCFVQSHSASACSLEGTSSPQALRFEARSCTDWAASTDDCIGWDAWTRLYNDLWHFNFSTCWRSLLTSASQSGDAGGSIGSVASARSLSKRNSASCSSLAHSDLQSCAHWTHSSALDNRFFALSINWAVCSACSATGGTVAFCCAFLEDTSNAALSPWSSGPKLVSAACNLVTFVEALARTSSEDKRARGGTSARVCWRYSRVNRPRILLSCDRPTVGHFSDGGLGPRMTWTQPSATGTELHPLRPRGRLTGMQKKNTRNSLEPKWLLTRRG